MLIFEVIQYSSILQKFIKNQHISILKIQRMFILTVIINQFFSSEIHGPIFSGPWIILPWVSEKSRRLFTVVFCGFICWKLSQELDKKHWPRIFVIIPPYFLIDVDIFRKSSRWTCMSEKKFNIFIMNKVCWWFISK